MTRFALLRVLLAAMGILSGSLCIASDIPATTRKVVYEKTEGGYRLKVVEAPVPAPGPRQVLLHVRVVSLNRGEIENLAQVGGRDRSGMIAASDAAGEVVALSAPPSTESSAITW